MNQDLRSTLAVTALGAQTFAISADAGSQYIDTQGYDSCTIVVTTLMSTADASNYFTVTLQESDDTVGANFSNVAAAELVGSFTLLDDTVQVTDTVGYIGTKRYLRVYFDETGTAVGAASVTAILSNGNSQPEVDNTLTKGTPS